MTTLCCMAMRAPRQIHCGSSSDAGSTVPFCAPRVVGRIVENILELFGADAAFDLPRHTHNQCVVGYLASLGYDRTGADQATLADPGTIEHDRPDADHRARPNCATMQHSPMTDGAIFIDGQSKSGIGVQNTQILDVGAGTDADWFVVAAQHRAEPDAGPRGETYFADDRRVGRDPGIRRFEFRGGAVQANQHDAALAYGSHSSGLICRSLPSSLPRQASMRLARAPRTHAF